MKRDRCSLGSAENQAPLRHVRPEVLDKGRPSEYNQATATRTIGNIRSNAGGRDADRALSAILASWAAILLYLWFRFGNWTFGAAAVICLIHDLCFTSGVIAVCHYLARHGLGKFLGSKTSRSTSPRSRRLADAGRLFGQRHDRRLRPYPRSSRQEPGADAANDQRQRQPNSEPNLLAASRCSWWCRALFLRRRRHSLVRLRDGGRRARRNLLVDLRRQPVAVDLRRGHPEHRVSGHRPRHAKPRPPFRCSLHKLLGSMLTTPAGLSCR